VSDLARRTDRPLAAADPGAKPNPLRQLPEEWREPVAFFYAVYSDTLKGTTGLVARFRLWMKDDGLTLDEARAVMKRLMRPARAGEIQYPGQLMAALAEEVADAVKARRALVQLHERRREQEASDARFAETPRPAIPGREVPGV
jgi:hypothetical protein